MRRSLARRLDESASGAAGAREELTRLRDAISRQRRELPWVRIDKDYSFEGSRGTQTLSDLFEGRSQLLVYHFMFDPD